MENLASILMISLLYDAAMRVQDLLDLQPDSFSRRRDFERHTNTYVCAYHSSKTSSHIEHPIKEQTFLLAMKYVEANKLHKSQRLFGLKMHQLRYRLQKFLKTYRPQDTAHIQLHDLRKSKACSLHRSGILDPFELQRFLHHRQMATTALYLEPNLTPKLSLIAGESDEALLNQLSAWE